MSAAQVVTFAESNNPWLDVKDLSNKTDVGSIPGTQWKLSSHKPGAGVAQLRDVDLGQVWQSDGVQPHVVDILFPRRTAVTHVSIYLDVTLDDSYTPTKIGIKAGTYFHDLAEVQRRELGPTKGWVHFVLSAPEMDEQSMARYELNTIGELPKPIWAYHLQVCIYANHQNGKDTHLRAVRVFGPPEDPPALHQGARAYDRMHGQLHRLVRHPSPPSPQVHSDAPLPPISRRSALLHTLR